MCTWLHVYLICIFQSINNIFCWSFANCLQSCTLKCFNDIMRTVYIMDLILVLLTRAWAEGYSNRLVCVSVCLFVCLSVCLFLGNLWKYSVFHMMQYGNGKSTTILSILCGSCCKIISFQRKSSEKNFRTVFGQSPYWNYLSHA